MYEKQIEVPEGVQVEIEGSSISASGQNGSVSKKLESMFGIKIEKQDSIVKVSTESDKRKQMAKVGTVIAHVRNMLKGVTEGYTAKVELLYSHFPATVKVDEQEREILIQNFIGEKTPRKAKIMGDDTKVEVDGSEITITGPDIEAVGQTAANMELVTKIKDHDRKVFQDGAFITKKPRGK